MSEPPTDFVPVTEPPPPGQWTKEDLINHVQTAMSVELSTLPIYFCAMYSIVQDNGEVGSQTRAHIRSIAEQEMLHLALAGNLLCSLDGKRALYDKSFMPKYPSAILFDKVPMKLGPANKENLECFMRIEAPYLPAPTPPVGPSALFAPIPKHRSIGSFYKDLEAGIQELAARDPTLFSQNKANQLRGSEFFNSAMTVVYDEATALEALATIVDQGEGGIGAPQSHYEIFVDLHRQPLRWKYVDYVSEPKTADYEQANRLAYHLSRGLDASYCLLLQTIDRCWQGDVTDASHRKQLLRNIHQLMVDVLSPLAHVLVQQRIGDKYAAPCFEFYPQEEKSSLPPHELFERLKGEIDEAQSLAASGAGDGLKETSDAIGMIAFRLTKFKQ